MLWGWGWCVGGSWSMEIVGEVLEARTTAATNWMAMHGQVDESTHDSSKPVERVGPVSRR